MASDDEALYCICCQPYDSNLFMIECYVCKGWFHGKCIDIKEYQASDIENYHCPTCQITHGPLVLKKRRNWHRHDYAEHDSSKAIQTGTIAFIKELKTRVFPSIDELPDVRAHGSVLTPEYFIANGFTTPLVIDKKDGLGLTVPPTDFSVDDVESYVGSMREVDVIDVSRQEDYKMLMREWTEYFKSPNRKKIYNVISLEFSNSRLSELVIAPKIVRQLSWSVNSWPSELPEDCSYTKPAVQKYCLMGVKDSFTDFHVDFGGSSVWYHILRGEKIFFLIPPTSANLALYENWLTSSNQSEAFLGDQVEKCYKCTVKQGQTAFLPSGWIHAVFTPIDTLVFGGNFLHDFSIESQLNVYEIEGRVRTEQKYLFPCFETSHWYKAKIILDYIKDCNDRQKLPHRHLLEGGKAIAVALKCWTKRKDFVKTANYEVPEHIRYVKLLKDLNKELKLYDAVSPEDSPRRTKKTKRVDKKKKKGGVTSEDIERLKNLKEETEKKLMKLQKHRGKLKSKKKHVKKDSTKTASLKLRIPKTGSYHDRSDATTGKKLKVKKWEKSQRITRLKIKVSNGKIVSPSPSNSLSSPEKSIKSENTENENTEAEGNESDTNPLVVDEKPPSKAKVKKSLPHASPVKSGTLKLRLSIRGRKVHELSDSGTPTAADVNITDVNINTSERKVDIKKESKTSPKKPTKPTKKHIAARMNMPVIRGGLNGSISDILEASGYGTETEIKIDNDSEYVASPGTREAIQGMLSMRNSESKRDVYEFDDEEEKLKSCYNDDNYFYPSLEMSDEEKDSKGHMRLHEVRDSNWNPRASVNVSQSQARDKLPRDGAKKESVGNTLAATAAKILDTTSPKLIKKKRAYVKKKRKPEPPVVPQLTSFEPIAGTSSMVPPTDEELLSQLKRPLSTPSSPNKATANKRPKKGFATAKQRLGRILKIHKMAF